MQITADSQASGGLTILPEIPGIPGVLIEGRNGIGKTILVRLLELISGIQPFAEHEKSWLSLRERIGATTITLTGLSGDQELSVRFTPEQWPDSQAPLVIGDWLGEVILNGERTSVTTAQDLLWVERFAGNEDLDRTLRRRLNIYADRVERTHGQISATIARVNEVLVPLVEQLRPLDPARLVAQQEELAGAQDDENKARSRLEHAIGRHNRVIAAIDNARRIDAAGDPAAELTARRAALQEQLSRATTERDEVQARVTETGDRLKREGDAQGALADAQRIHRHRAKRVRNLQSTTASQAKELNVEPKPDHVLRTREQAREQLAVLRKERAALDAGGQTARLIDRFDGLLVSADAEGLDEQELAVIGGQRYSVEQVHAGMLVRAEELRGRPLPEDLVAIDSAIADAARRVSGLNSLIRTLQDLTRQLELLEEAEEEVEVTSRRADAAGALDEAFREDSRRLGQLEEQIDRLGIELARLYEQMGLTEGRSLEDAQADLASELEQLGFDNTGSLPEEEEAARRHVEEATEALKRAGERASSLRRAVTVVQAAIDSIASTLSTDPNWSWLVPEPISGSAEGLARFATARKGLIKLEDRLDNADRLLASFGTVANAALNPEDALVGTTARVAAVRRVLGKELREFLDTRAIREALFDGAELVDVDPVEAQLTIESADGRSTRPFESFSTGEQAFAFTQARIRELVAPREPNRLLVLDEFGAFVAADRLPALIEFLNTETLDSICDQVIVILPLQVDYEADLEFTTGELAEKYRERAAQITERGYCAVPLGA